MLKIPYELWIGARYAGLARIRQRRGRRDRFISFIAASSMAGIALGVAALIVVLSVMNGFQKEVRDRMLSVLPHIELYLPGASPERVLEQWQQFATAAERNPEVKAGAPFVAAQGMLVRGQALRGVQVRGIDPATEGNVSDLPRQMVSGKLTDLKPGGFGVVLGNELADGMGVKVGDTLLMMAPQGSISPAGFAPRMRQFTVVGVFSSGHYEYDSSLAFVDNEDAARVFRESGTAGVRLRIADMQKAPEVAAELRNVLPPYVMASDWSRNNRTWFAAVQTEKRMMFLILALIVAVAAFNLLSSLVMAVKDKQSDIAILRTLGAGPGEVARIFLVQGALIGVIGTLLGVAGGIAIAYNVDVIVPFIERMLGVHFLPREIYFISALPSDPQVGDIVTIGVTSLVLSLLATLYPSWRASRLQPAQVLRHD
ncbi:lipoprotein-releasing ABC transporter permease subunit [Achromobacter mucicolens]|uniref:Lipoprotein-releasing ABC transporter permease subunit n=4 Tax=cellular organisms TaxID=131567 RepID=A0ABD4YNK5_9BURK|nr:MULTISPECIES: lipoprotein-releasing ABC transporter permease subunit [Achromobacter]KXJ64715.1 cell division protein FtsX [Achromobacter xylosoxidans]MBV7501796.1 lipoprotein-releasing ABC transporter permease subunit [Achromobacter sp. ACM05]MCG7326528.1 lipoprotein-releasing ABC transporter permease subunit [Achromobacter sp. ACRQX]OXC89979.1 lipoprotein-releasing system transmembrane subunit LolC [Achromobacter sp. KAs 3-5]KRB16156.1 cell division protein FtsX [Achromobacter sp. Root170]